MALDFVAYLNQQLDWTTEKKNQLLNEAAYGSGYSDNIIDPDTGLVVPNPVSKKTHINGEFKESFISWVKKYRKDQKEAEAEALLSAVATDYAMEVV